MKSQKDREPALLKIPDSLYRRERSFQILLRGAAWLLLVLMALLFITLLYNSWPAIKEFGLDFLWKEEWNVVTSEFSVWPFLAGTLLSSFLALLIALPFALAVALFLGEYYPQGWFSDVLRQLVDLLAGIPSVVYGLWGLFVLVPVIRNWQLALGVIPWGVGIFTAALVLAIMIIPYAASLAREVMLLVPHDLREAAYALGATRFEVIWHVVFPYTRSGIIAGVLLALGRALGETMAVTMVIGNSNYVPKGIFSPANTMASLIANEFNEATNPLNVAALIEVALVLLLVTWLINLAGKWLIFRNR